MWFEALVGASVTFVKRNVQVPADVMAAAQKPAAQVPSKKGKPSSAASHEAGSAG